MWDNLKGHVFLDQHALARRTIPLSFNALQEILPKPIDSQVLQEVEAVSLKFAVVLHASSHVAPSVQQH